MLSEAVIAGADKLRREPSGRLSPYMISSCALRTYKNWKGKGDPPTGVQRLRMNDGHYQEQEMMDDLVRAGFEITDRQLPLHIGPMHGRLDGLITVDSKIYLLECKAMSLTGYTKFKQRGFGVQPGFRVQTQLYLASDELRKIGVDSGFLYCKHKDTCSPFDLFFERDPEFTSGIEKQVQSLLDGKVPVPSRCPVCPVCPHRLECWGAEVVDFSGVHTASLPEMVAQWKTGTAHKQMGKELVDESRAAFKAELGDKDVIFIDDLKVLKIFPVRGGISETKFVEKYGAAALAGVWEEKRIEQMRVQEVEL